MNHHRNPKEEAKDMGLDMFCRYYALTNGRTFFCQDCHEMVSIDEMRPDQETCPFCGSEEFGCMNADDFILIFDRMEYIIDDDGLFVGGRLVKQYSGVRVTIDTQKLTILAECEDERYKTDTYYNCESLNDALRRRWNKVHRDQYIREGYRWGPPTSGR